MPFENGGRRHEDLVIDDKDIFFPKRCVTRAFAAFIQANLNMIRIEQALQTRGLRVNNAFGFGQAIVGTSRQLEELRCSHTRAISSIFIGDEGRVCAETEEVEGFRNVPCPPNELEF